MGAAVSGFSVVAGGRARGIDGDADEAVVGRARRGDRAAFDELYRRHVDLVWGRLGRLIGPDPEREDLVQQIFLEVFRDLGRFRGDASFRTFLYRVVVNTACDHLKRRGRRPRAIAASDIEALVDGAASPETRAVERDRLAFTMGLLDRIKPKKRVAFLLRVVEGLSLEEIAELCQANAAAVAQRIRHAHRELTAMRDRALEEKR
jgi:RNA polymerase sigma-70 factor, ECF subfamily